MPCLAGYNHAKWREDVKRSLAVAGLRGEGAALIFKDNEIFEPQVLDDIVQLLVNGELQNLYDTEEVEEIATIMEPYYVRDAAMKGEDVDTSRISNQDYLR